MRYLVGLVCVLALGVMPLVGCSDTEGMGGSGGEAGTGGSAGDGGMGGTNLCEGVTCEDDENECTGDGVCDPADGMCDYAPVEDGTECGEGVATCQGGSCTFACTEQGIRDAITVGGGPYRFACDGPTTVEAEASIGIDKGVILDGEGNLTVRGGSGALFYITGDEVAELHGFTVSGVSGGGWDAAIVVMGPEGQLLLSRSTVSMSSNSMAGILLYGGSARVVDSTVSHNDGIGIASYGTFSGLSVVNSTVSGNAGGGISVQVGHAYIQNATVLGNSEFDLNFYIGSPSYPGDCCGSLELRGSLVGQCDPGVGESLGYNIESPGNTCGLDHETDQVNVSAEQLNLAPLQDNGGPTETHALGAGSVAADVIPEDDCVDAEGAPLTTDQRGVARPHGDACDVGAFEGTISGWCVESSICDDGNECTVDGCATPDGPCLREPLADGTPCAEPGPWIWSCQSGQCEEAQLQRFRPPHPLALNCALGDFEVNVPFQFVVTTDSSPVGGEPLTARIEIVLSFPYAAACDLYERGYLSLELLSSTQLVSVLGANPTNVELSMPGTPAVIDLGRVCAAPLLYGRPGLDLAYDSVTVEVTADGTQQTVDFQLSVEGMFLDIANIAIGSSPAIPELPLPASCTPVDKTVPPNGSTSDPEDSPRVASDLNEDGSWSVWASPDLQVQIPVSP